jgi:hypothetical protein
LSRNNPTGARRCSLPTLPPPSSAPSPPAGPWRPCRPAGEAARRHVAHRHHLELQERCQGGRRVHLIFFSVRVYLGSETTLSGGQNCQGGHRW